MCDSAVYVDKVGIALVVGSHWSFGGLFLRLMV
jgi:hypothetical protein